MLNDQRFRKYIKYQIITLIISVLIGIFMSSFINNAYTSEVVRIKKEIAANIVESEEINIIDVLTINEMSNYEIDQILEKYELDNIINYKGFNNLDKVNTRVITYIIGLIILINLTYATMAIVRYTQERKRINEVNLYLSKILNNDFSLDIQDYDDDTLAALKNDIYKITNKLRYMSEYSINEKKNLEMTLSDISHQLKTPLTSMFVINTILQDDLSDEVRLDFLKKNHAQLEKIEWLVKSLLKMSQIDSGTIEFSKERVKVIDIVNRALNPNLITIELKDINLSIEVDDNFYVDCDFNWTSEAVSNIINNAVEHTPVNGAISITLRQSSHGSIISISDNGPGISLDDQVNIFKRFYKKDSKSDGIGIGMNLSKSIMNRQHGDIRVKSVVNEGSIFEVIIN